MTEQLQEMKARLEAATPGPWVTGWDGQEYYVAPEWSSDYPHERIAEWTYAIHPGNSIEMGECATQNADLIAHAPETQAKLIAALEAVEALAKGARRMVTFTGATVSGVVVADDVLAAIAKALA